ncbi:hypothetical protein [Lacipirellula sp.]|uniref:hypothetical protein n=1 Tax=Lacipirellula sp. TaxID=2691419 RepID=UPI003D10B602
MTDAVLLSDRQQILLGRLEDLATAIVQQRLPANVTEILGFGSFFRGDASPRDVDLLFRVADEQTEKYQRFIHILRAVREDVNFQVRHDRPVDAFLEVCKSGHDVTPVDDDERILFSEWLAPYSWSMLFPAAIYAGASWYDAANFTRRLMLKRFPKLNIVSYLRLSDDAENFGLRTGFVVSLWSNRSPAMRLNVLKLLSPVHTVEATLKDLRHLDQQIHLLRLHIAEIRSLIGALKTTRRNTSAISNSHTWYRNWMKRRKKKAILPSAYDTLIAADWLLRDDDYVDGAFFPTEEISYESEMPSIIRNAATKRRLVKELWKQLELGKDAARLLITLKSDVSDSPLTDYQYVLLELLNGRSEKVLEEKRQILRGFGIR